MRPWLWRCAVCLILGQAPAWAEDSPEVRVGTLQYGTVNWEIAVIRSDLDQAYGFVLEPVVLADKDAAAIAFQSGDLDVIVTDWIWVARQRARGRDFTFVPYSLAVGAVMADPAKGIDSLDDLVGKRVGVAGGPDDKSWVLVQAYARKELGLDLAQEADVEFAAPPLLNALVLRGELDAALNFWQFNAQLKAEGLIEVIAIDEILPALGFARPPPLLGWVFRESWAEENPSLVKGLLEASYDAKELMGEDDEVWQELRPLMRAEDDALFAVLKAGYRSGIPSGYDLEDEAAARAILELMAEIAPTAVGGLSDLPPGTFWPGYAR